MQQKKQITNNPRRDGGGADEEFTAPSGSLSIGDGEAGARKIRGIFTKAVSPASLLIRPKNLLVSKGRECLHRPLLGNARSSTFALAILLLLSMLLLAACGSGSSGSTGNSSPSSASAISATPTQNANHVSLAKLVGIPTAKITSGANFEVTGQVQNLDKLQHDIYLQATLKNASGKVIGVARGLADNVAAGDMDTYTLQGTLMQPTWSTVVVVITKVSENVNGQGSD